MQPTKFIPFLIWGCLWLVACGVQPVQSEAVNPADDPTVINSPASVVTDTPVTTAQVPVALNLKQVLAQQLHVDITSVQIVSAEEKMWPDPCLGAPYADEMCAQQETAGYRIILAVNNNQYIYHTDLEGNQIRVISLPEPFIGERILTWFSSDDSGCRTVEVGADGVSFGRCGRVLMGVPFSFDTREADIAELAGKYASFVAETPVGTVNFVGYGPNVATPAEQRMLAEWAKLVYQEAESGRSGASWGLIFAWHREGGPAGFCDDVSVYVTGQLYVSSCRGEQPVDIGRMRLTADQLARVFGWVDTLQPFEYNPTASSAADGVTIQMVFSGAGSQPATELEMTLISEFAQILHNEVSMQAALLPPVCLKPNTKQQVLIGQVQGYCLLYPAEYSLVQPNPDSIEIVKDTVMNHIDPRVSITVEPAAGRSLDDVIRQLESDYVPSGFDVVRGYITVDGIEAVMLDNLPGQDLNRRVAFIQNGRLYSLFFAPIGDEGSEVRRQAEMLYQQVLDSFRFLEATVPTPTPAPSEITVVPSNVQYVMALVDINIRSGPGTNYSIVGSVFGGQIARVTGLTTDGDWWRVICPDDTVGNCFVIADPNLTQPTTAPGSKPTPPPVNETGEAVVESIEVQILESFPVQVQAVVQGYLPDVCTFIDHVNLVRQDFSFYIKLKTVRQANARCALQLTPFSEVVRLEMQGLPAGQYQIFSQNVSATFNWDNGGSPGNNVPERIEFQPGRTSETIASRVLADTQPKLYVLQAQAGQTMIVRLTSTEGWANFSLVGMSDGQPLKRMAVGDPVWRGVLPLTQDYLITIAPTTGTPANYELYIEIPPLPGTGRTERIQFTPGSSSATVYGYTIAIDPQRYILGAQAGQQMSVTLDTPSVHTYITVLTPSGENMAGADGPIQNWSGTLPVDGDYMIEVINSGTGSADFALTVSIQ